MSIGRRITAAIKNAQTEAADLAKFREEIYNQTNWGRLTELRIKYAAFPERARRVNSNMKRILESCHDPLGIIKIHKYPDNCLKILKMTERWFKEVLKVEDDLGKLFKLHAGIEEGSVLSEILIDHIIALAKSDSDLALIIPMRNRIYESRLKFQFVNSVVRKMDKRMNFLISKVSVDNLPEWFMAIVDGELELPVTLREVFWAKVEEVNKELQE